MKNKLIVLGNIILLSLVLLLGCGVSEETKAQRGGFPDIETYREASTLKIQTYQDYKDYLTLQERNKREEAKKHPQVAESLSFLRKWEQKILIGKGIVSNLLQNKENQIEIPFLLKDSHIRLLVTQEEWDSLSDNQQQEVCLYIKSTIPMAKENPEPYETKLSYHPSLRLKYHSVAKNMCYDCWAIVTAKDYKTLDSVVTS